MESSTRTSEGVEVPAFLYGTAWKEERTRECVAAALAVGFRGIDTANQRKHYVEAGVGDAIREAIDRGALRRDELFLQTKFTSRDGQDSRLPYDPRASITEQVHQSFASSLEHLHTDRIESLVLHGPTVHHGLADADLEAWSAMESIARSGRVRCLGVSNVSAAQLELLCRHAAIAPTFVQNRCYASRGWDAAVREVADRRRVIYQAFSLLTANRAELANGTVRSIAARHRRSVPEVVFRFARALGMLPLTGSTSVEHLRADASIDGFELDAEEVETIRTIGASR